MALNIFPDSSGYKTDWPWVSHGIEAINENFNIFWPRITVITPSYNQGQYLEETIRSVLLQGFPNLEYFVIDGGSSDNSVEIIKIYQPWIDYWVSEPDRGQAHAINKGLERATGDIILWVNSDDYLLPGSLNLFALAYQTNPPLLIAGDVEEIEQSSTGGKIKRLVKQKGIELNNFICYWEEKYSWHQVGIGFPSTLLKKIGLLDETLTYGFDHDLMCRCLQLTTVQYLHKTVARFRLHSESKTVRYCYQFPEETYKASKRYWHINPQVDKARARRYLVLLLLRESARLIKQRKIVSVKIFLKAFLISPKDLFLLVYNKILSKISNQ